MKKSRLVRTVLWAATLLLSLSGLNLHSHAAAGDVDLSFDPGSGVNGPVNAVVLQPDGKVIIGGQFTTVRGLVRTNIARLNPDGTGDSGFMAPAPDNPVYTLALQADGKVLVGSEGYNFGLTRLNSNGSADTNFNANAYAAIVSIDPYHRARIFAIVVQPDGKVLAAGIENLLRLNANGTLDNSFTSGHSGFIYSLALQPDGKVIIGGYLYDPANNSSNYGLARLHANGSIDHTFDGAAGQNGIFNSIVVQPDGRVLVGGKFIGTNNTCVARLNGNGTMDATFVEVTGVGKGTWPEANAIQLQPDGKVIIGGQFVSIHGQSRTNLARLNSDGSLDSDFPIGTGGVDGQPQSYPGTSVKAIALQTNGTIFIGGAFTAVNGTNRNRVARLLGDGSLAPSFLPGQGLDNYVNTLVVEPSGKVLVGGPYTFLHGTNRFALAALNADGSRDSTFTSSPYFDPNLVPLNPYEDCPGGNYTCDRVGYAMAALLQPDGKVLVGGFVETTVRGEEVWVTYNHAVLGRFDINGIPDTNFSAIVGDPGDSADFVSELALQPDGKIIIGGHFKSVNGTNRSGIARLNSNGTLDNSFLPPTRPYATISSVAVQPDGKVLMCGSFGVIAGKVSSGIVRLNANGSLDNTFTSVTGTNGGVNSLALQPDGKVVIGGSFTNINGTNLTSIARLNSNGSLDNSFTPGNVTGGFVGPIALQSNGDILIGGSFLTFNGVLRPHLARLHGESIATAPTLSITRSTGFVIISWPTSATGFQLQETTDLSLSNSWSPVAQPAVTNSGRIAVTVPASLGNKFFRLHSQ